MNHRSFLQDDGAGPSTARTPLYPHTPGESDHYSLTSSDKELFRHIMMDEGTSQPHGAHDFPQPHGAHELPQPHGDQDLPQDELVDLVERGERVQQLRDKLEKYSIHNDMDIHDPRFERQLQTHVSFEIELEKRLRMEGYTPDSLNRYRDQIRELILYNSKN